MAKISLQNNTSVKVLQILFLPPKMKSLAKINYIGTPNMIKYV